jgi:YVTN family beta-propeller protein
MLRPSLGGIVFLAALLVASTALVSITTFASPSNHPGIASFSSSGGVSSARPAPVPALDPPAAPPMTVGVGGGPDSVLVDPTNGSVFVASQYDDNVSVIAIATNEVVATIPVGLEPYAQGIALDPINWTVYVVNSGSDNVSVISIGEQTVIASVPVGADPNAIAFNAGNHEMYVSNGGSGSVSIISPATHLPRVIDTVPVGPDPDALAVNPTTHDVFVADAGSNNVSVISGETNTVVRTVTVGSAPGAFGSMLFDSQNGRVYVANVGSNNVSVLWGSNGTLNATIPVGNGPTALALDVAAKEVFVANHFSDNISVLSTVSNEVVASVGVGVEPATDGALAFSAATNYLYVPNGGSGNVSVISAASNTVTGSIAVGDQPDAIAADPVNATAVYVANQGSSSVSILVLTQVTFAVTGLPAATLWSVSVGLPPVVYSDITVKTKGSVTVLVPSGTVSYALTPPAGYGVSKVTGPLFPTLVSANVSGAKVTLAVKFGHIESLTFSETTLPTLTPWGITLHTTLKHGGPAPESASTTGSSVAFSVVQGSYKYYVRGNPNTYGATPAHGSVTVGVRAITKTVKFALVTATVVFHEVGLGKGTPWDVNLTGPMDVSVRTMSPTIKFHLVNGTYSFSVSNFTLLHPHPPSGTIVVTAPHAYPTVTVSFTASGGHGDAARILGGGRSTIGAPVAEARPTSTVGRPDA